MYDTRNYYRRKVSYFHAFLACLSSIRSMRAKSKGFVSFKVTRVANLYLLPTDHVLEALDTKALGLLHTCIMEAFFNPFF